MKITIEIDDPEFEPGQEVRIPDDWQKIPIYAKVVDRVFQDAQIHETGEVSIGRWTYGVKDSRGHEEWYEQDVLALWEAGKVFVFVDWEHYEPWYQNEVRQMSGFDPNAPTWRFLSEEADDWNDGVRYYVHQNGCCGWIPARYVLDLKE